MTENFAKYELMRDSGCSPEEVYHEAVRDQIDPIARVRLIRAVFSLSAGEAKEVVVRAEGEAKSLDEHQTKIANAMESSVACPPLSQRSI